jgi:5-methylcytosine-specific restriction endonuclease McrA
MTPAERHLATYERVVPALKACADCGELIPLPEDYRAYTGRKRCDACSAARRTRSAAERYRQRRDPFKSPMPVHASICEHCGDPFTGIRTQRFCSTKCNRKAQYVRLGRVGGVYRGATPAKQAAWKRRRALLSDPSAERIVPGEVFARDGWTCALCADPVDPELRHPDPLSASLDHRVPLALGGLHCWDNVQLAHLVCNTRKGDRLAD